MRISSVVYPIATIAGVIAVWESRPRIFAIPSYLLPGPTHIVASCIQHAGLLLQNAWVTTVEIVLGYLLSIVVGVPLAFAIFMWPAFSRSMLPLLISSQAIPKVAVAPVAPGLVRMGLLYYVHPHNGVYLADDALGPDLRKYYRRLRVTARLYTD